MADMLFNLLTPSAMIYSNGVQAVYAQGSDGDFGILANHIPMIAALRRGIVRAVTEDGAEQVFVVDGGVLEVQNNRVVLMTTGATPCKTKETAKAVLTEKKDRRVQ